jgi:hypothetical protein
VPPYEYCSVDQGSDERPLREGYYHLMSASSNFGRQPEGCNTFSRRSLTMRKIPAVGIGLGLTDIGPGGCPLRGNEFRG